MPVLPPFFMKMEESYARFYLRSSLGMMGELCLFTVV